MAQPQRHPKTGVFRFRRIVPPDLRALLGKTEELISLGTKDAAEARVRYAKISAEVEARWANLRKAPQTLTEREASALAVAVHDGWLDRHRDNPSEPSGWRTDLYDQLWAEPDLWDLGQPMEARIRDLAASVASPARAQEEWCVAQADRVLSERGLRVDQVGRTKLARAVANAIQRASLTLHRAAQGEIIIDASPAADSLRVADGQSGGPSSIPSSPAGLPKDPGAAKPLPLTSLFEAWWQEAKATGLKPNTYQSYRTAISHLTAFLEHDDATLVTADDIVRFKDHRLTTPSKRTGKPPSPKTVKDSDLAALKSVFGWAVINRKLSDNPAKGLTIKLPKAQRLRDPGFTDEEARAILSLSLGYKPGKRENNCTAAAKRWVPWICAFTGARAGEIAQARRQDLRRVGEIWVLHITPEAGTVKQNEARDVPLHPQLIELGFSDFVEACPAGHLFVTPSEAGDVLGPLDGLTNRLRDFVKPPLQYAKVQPNHAWRHRFRTVGRELGIDSSVLNAIDGHAAGSVAERYGSVTLKAKNAAIIKFPYFKI